MTVDIDGKPGSTINQILTHKVSITVREYKVRWDGYTSEWDNWVIRTDLHPEVILNCKMWVGVYDWNGKYRCPK